MTRLLQILILITTFWSLGIFTASAQGSCQLEVDEVVKDIRRRGTTINTYIITTHINSYKYYQESLGNIRRIGYIVFLLNTKLSTEREGFVAANIINSVILTKSYATRIFRKCYGTGTISFGMNGTDWSENFGMTDNNILGNLQCSKNPDDITNRISSLISPDPDGYYCAFVVPDF